MNQYLNLDVSKYQNTSRKVKSIKTNNKHNFKKVNLQNFLTLFSGRSTIFIRPSSSSVGEHDRTTLPGYRLFKFET